MESTFEFEKSPSPSLLKLNARPFVRIYFLSRQLKEIIIYGVKFPKGAVV